MSLLEYEISADILLIGERIKKGTFRPVLPEIAGNGYRPLPYSTATGALREYLSLRFDAPVHAAGYLTGGQVETLVISPRDNVTGVSKLPITIQYLTGVKGKLFILINEHTVKLETEFDMVMGGMRYKGMGLCRLKRIPAPPVNKKEGILLTRIPVEALTYFGIELSTDKYTDYNRGYLFKPTSETGGVYVKSLFEGSEVEGPGFLLGGEKCV